MAELEERQARVSGAALVALHALVAFALLGRCDRPALSLTVAGEGGVTVVEQGGAPGLRRAHLEKRYRGGFVERIGRSELVGPFQSPDAPPCSVRLTLGQSLLEQIEAPLRAQVQAGLRGQLGFHRVDAAEIRFVEAPAGIAVHLELAFSHALVPVDVRVTPRLVNRALEVRAVTSAKIRLRSAILAGAVELFGQDRRLDALVTQVAAGEVDKVLGPVAALLAEPPPVPVGDGRTLGLRYCGEVEARADRWLSVPLAVPVAPGARGYLPVALPGVPPPALAESDLALDVSLDAVNAVLFDAWRSGQLDLLLARAGLDRRFNDSDEVRELLTLRAGPPRLAIPPVVTPSPGELPLDLALEAELDLHDGALTTPARLFLRVGLDLVSGPAGATARVALRELDLTCLPRPDRLVACYPLLVERARAGADRLYPAATALLAGWFDALIAGRSLGGQAGAPDFVLRSARLSHRIDNQSGWFRVEMRGALSP